MCACMLVCVLIYTCTHVYTCVHNCTHMYTYTHVYTGTHVQMSTQVHKNRSVYTYIVFTLFFIEVSLFITSLESGNISNYIQKKVWKPLDAHTFDNCVLRWKYVLHSLEGGDQELL